MPLPFRTRPANGFSLVEMMVVLFVMGLLATAAVLSIPGDERKLRAEAERFAARTIAARDEAITGAVPVALVVGSAGYYFERRVDGAWQPFPEGRFGLTGWVDGTSESQSASAGTGDAAAARSRIVFDPVGLASNDAAVRLVHGQGVLTVRIVRDGRVTVDAR